MKPPFTYFGGKTSIAGRIAALLPPHEHYVEPFAGWLAVLLAKPPSRMETVNDLDGDLMNFWACSGISPGDLERACLLTPHARAEYQQACQPLDGFDDLERARRVWVRLTQGRHRTAIPWAGWRHRVGRLDGPDCSLPAELANLARRVTHAAARLADVTLESLPALEIIAKYGSHPGVIVYADPPYPAGVRGIRPRYAAEMHGDDGHRELLGALCGCRGPVILSGYACPLYDDALSSWHRREIATQTTNGTGDLSRTEVLWSNRPFPGQGSLFDEAV